MKQAAKEKKGAIKLLIARRLEAQHMIYAKLTFSPNFAVIILAKKKIKHDLKKTFNPIVELGMY